MAFDPGAVRLRAQARKDRYEYDVITLNTTATILSVTPMAEWSSAAYGMADNEAAQEQAMKEVTDPQEQQDPVPDKAKDAADYANNNNSAAQPGYKGGGAFENDGRGNGQILDRTDPDGNPINYKEYDVNPRVPGQNRGTERVVMGSDGRSWYTMIIKTFTEIK
jgi:hypothetical protein